MLPLFTANPTYTFCPMLIVWLVPNGTQFTPSEETELLKLLPLLATFTQYGSVALTPPGSEVLPPVAVRTSKKIPPKAAQSAVLAFVEPALSPSRIITPAVTYPDPPCRLTSRAMIVPSPDKG